MVPWLLEGDSAASGSCQSSVPSQRDRAQRPPRDIRRLTDPIGTPPETDVAEFWRRLGAHVYADR